MSGRQGGPRAPPRGGGGPGGPGGGPGGRGPGGGGGGRGHPGEFKGVTYACTGCGGLWGGLGVPEWGAQGDCAARFQRSGGRRLRGGSRRPARPPAASSASPTTNIPDRYTLIATGGGGGGRGYAGGGGGGGGSAGGEMSTQAAMASVAQQLGQLKLTAAATRYNPGADVPYQRAVRPGLGTQGRQMTVLANHFGLALKAKQAFHYDVSSEPRGTEGGVERGLRVSSPGADCFRLLIQLESMRTTLRTSPLPPSHAPQSSPWTPRAGPRAARWARAGPGHPQSAARKTVSVQSAVL
jgi:hypothetical protein